MNQEQLLRDLIKLPPIAQQELADFIEFLRFKYIAKQTINVNPVTDMLDEPFIGMWRDRTDMADSNKWVRDMRVSEWE